MLSQISQKTPLPHSKIHSVRYPRGPSLAQKDLGGFTSPVQGLCIPLAVLIAGISDIRYLLVFPYARRSSVLAELKLSDLDYPCGRERSEQISLSITLHSSRRERLFRCVFVSCRRAVQLAPAGHEELARNTQLARNTLRSLVCRRHRLADPANLHALF